MSLDEEIQVARREIVSDGYDMSVGEIINLYKADEIHIHPEFQRLFRWDLTRKTRFIESLLLGLPLPPIFVYQGTNGVWELIDGLQRLSTIFEFIGELKGPNGALLPATTLEGTRFLPSLVDMKWNATKDDGTDGIGPGRQIAIKRARMRVEILKPESDPQSKYELFQRLNTGGESLTEQEIRNCIGVMLNPEFQDWLSERANWSTFTTTIDQTESALQSQMHLELALRFVAFRHVPYRPGLDVHEYLDEALSRLATDPDFNRGIETTTFEQTFTVLNECMGSDAFKRWNGAAFAGKFLMSVFEVVAIGVSKNVDALLAMQPADRRALIQSRCKDLWANAIFSQYSGAGVRGSRRLTNLLPIAATFFRP